MKTKKVLIRILAAVITVGLCPIQSIYAKEVSEPKYGNEFLDNYGFETATVGAYQDNNWRIYHSPSVAYAEFVSSDIYPDYVLDKIAYRFCLTKGGGGQHGLYYNKELAAGVEYEFSGMFTTDSDAGADLNVFYQDQQSHLEYWATEKLTKGEWKNIKFRIKINEDAYSKVLRIATNLKSQCAYDGSNYNNLKNAIIASGQSFVYCDNLSIRPVSDFWIENEKLEATSYQCDALVRVKYDYLNVAGNNEAGSLVTYQINTANSKEGWNDYKTIPGVVSEDAEESSIIALDSSCSGMYLRAIIQPINQNGKYGASCTTDAVFIDNTANIVCNPTFKWKAVGWTGGQIDEEESLFVINNAAEYICDYNVTALTSFNINVCAGGTGEMNVYINNKLIKTKALLNDIEEIAIPTDIDICNNIKIRFEGENIKIKELTIEPQTPAVYGLKVIGKPIAGNLLTASYTYDNSKDSGKNEGNSLIEWYVNGSKCAEGMTFTPEQNTKGTIKLVITPVNEFGVSGNARSITFDYYTLYVYDLKISASSYKTNGILVPSYKYGGSLAESNSKLEWVQSDSAEAPIDEWEVIDVANSVANQRGVPKNKVTSLTVADDGWIPLNQTSRGKYVAFRITPIDINNREGNPTLSKPTPIIEFERNLANNGDFSKELMSKNWYAQAMAYREDNSTIPDENDKTGSLLVNGESIKSAYDEKNDSTVANGGSTVAETFPSFVTQEGIKYLVSLDAKLDYSHDAEMGVNFLYVTSNGYACKQTMCNSKEWTRMNISFDGKSGSDVWSYISVRGGGNPDDSRIIHAGRILIDNLEIVEAIPYVDEIKVTGEAKVGKTLTASYTFGNVIEADEYDSTIRWMISDNKWGPWEEYKTMNGKSGDYTLSVGNDLIGKNIRFEVTPQDVFGVKGRTVLSTEEYFVAPNDIISKNVELDGMDHFVANASFKNVQKADRKITAILVGYKNNSKAAEVNEIRCKSQIVGANQTMDFEDITLSRIDNDFAELIFVEGNKLSDWHPVYGHIDSKETNVEANRTIISQEDGVTEVYVKTAYGDEPCLVFALRAGIDEEDVTDANINNMLSYIGYGKTYNNGSTVFRFLPKSITDGDTFKIGVNFSDNLKYRYDLEYDQTALVSIIDKIKTSDADTVSTFVQGSKIDGLYDMCKVLSIDNTYYLLLNDKSKINLLLAGKDFTGQSGKIREIIEDNAKKYYEEEVWEEKITNFITEISSISENELRSVLTKYNDILALKLEEPFGFGIDLATNTRSKFDSEILTKIKQLINSTDYKATEKAIKDNFDSIVALAAINNGPWDKMDSILSANWSIIGLGTYEKYSNNAYDKAPMYQNIFKNHFETLSQAKIFIEGEIANLRIKNEPIISMPQGGSGGGSGGGTSIGSGLSGIVSNPDILWDFGDVQKSHWAYDAITKCAEKGIMRGYPDGSFGTESTITRAEFISVILRCAKIDNAYAEAVEFDDVLPTDWFAKDIYTAYKLGLISGVSENQIAPNDNITREQMAAIVYRLFRKKFSVVSENDFSDKKEISEYARNGVNALVTAGILQGVGEGLFAPKAFLTRAMTAQIAVKLCDMEQ